MERCVWRSFHELMSGSLSALTIAAVDDDPRRSRPRELHGSCEADPGGSAGDEKAKGRRGGIRHGITPTPGRGSRGYVRHNGRKPLARPDRLAGPAFDIGHGAGNVSGERHK